MAFCLIGCENVGDGWIENDIRTWSGVVGVGNGDGYTGGAKDSLRSAGVTRGH